MNARALQLLAAALLLAPLAASAQSAPRSAPHPTTHAAAAPAIAPAPAVPPTPAVAPARESMPDDPVADEGMWEDDDLFAFGLADAFYLESGDLEADDAEGSAQMEETHGRREFETDPGAPLDTRRMRGRMAPGLLMRRAWLGGHPMMRHGMALRMRLELAQLDLSEAQRGKLRDMHEASARKAVQRRADLELARLDLAKLMRAGKPDAGAVNAQIDRLARLRADGLKAAFEMRMQARGVLTPEQLQKLRGRNAPPMLRHDMMDTPDGRPKR